MTVKELLETNMELVDVQITLRSKEGWLLNELNIGPDYGVVPPYPQMVPKDESYAGTDSLYNKKQAQYIQKNINAYDDGKDYFQLCLNRFPKGWLDLEVFSWHQGYVYPGHHQRKVHPGEFNWHGIRITANRYEDTLIELEEPKAIEKKNEQLEGQMDIFDFVDEVTE